MQNPTDQNHDTQNAALYYATVREQRHAIETAIRLLNEVASQVTKCHIKAADHIMAIRNLLDEKDSRLFDIEQDLYFKITR